MAVTFTKADKALVMRVAHNHVWSTRGQWGFNWVAGAGYGRALKGAERLAARRKALAEGMRAGWAHVRKMVARRAAAIAAQATARPLDTIRADLDMLENKDRWTQADYRRADELRREAQVHYV